MKRKVVFGCIVGIACLFFILPRTVSQGAEDGLHLWFQVVFPSLLPFMIFSGVVVKLSFASAIGRGIYPVFHRLFGLSENGCYPVVIGLLSGYPVGAKTVADLCREHSISREEGNFLITLCNNTSPMFMLEYMAIHCMNLKRPLLLLGVVYSSAFCSAMVTCFASKGKNQTKNRERKSKTTVVKCSVMEAVDSCILDSFVTLAKVGGYIILFSILTQVIQDMLPVHGIFRTFLVGTLEITTGGAQLYKLHSHLLIEWIFCCMFCAFGGASSVAQTASVIKNSPLSMKVYITAKIRQALIAAALAVITVFMVR